MHHPERGCIIQQRRSVTGEKGESPHGREGMIPGCVDQVQLIHFSADSVHLPVEVFDRRSVILVEVFVQKSARTEGVSSLEEVS